MRTVAGDWFPRELPRGLRIGERCYVYSSYAFLHCDESANNEIIIGDDVGIYHGTMFELGPRARVHIGNVCSLVGPIIRAELDVHIGNYVGIGNDVIISDCEGYTHAQPRPSSSGLPPASCKARPIWIGDEVHIGIRVVVLAGVTIGDGAAIGAGAVVAEDVPPLALAVGNPARVVRMIGEKR